MCADTVVSSTYTFDNQVSAGADAATAALNKFADSADAADVKVTKATASATRLANTQDGVTKSTNAVRAAVEAYNAATLTMQVAVDNGSKTQAQMDGVLSSLSAKIRTTQAALDAATLAAANNAQATVGAAPAYAAISAAMDAAISKAREYQVALNANVGITLPSTTVHDQQATRVMAYGAALDDLRAKYDPLFAATQRYQGALAEIDMAQRVGAISAGTATDAAVRMGDAYLKTVESINAAQAALRNGGTAFQQQVNASIGVLPPTSASDYAKRDADIQAYGASMDNLRAKYDPLFAVSKQYEVELNNIADAQAKGAISADVAAAATERATAAFAKNAGINSHAEALDNLRAKYDPLFAVSKRYEAELNGIADAQAQGAISTSVAAAATDRATAAFEREVTTAGAATHAHNKLGQATGAVTREFIVVADEILNGRWSRIPGSILVVSEYVGSLRDNIARVAVSLFSLPGLFIATGVAAAGSLAVMAVLSENALLASARLSQQLSATRGDYVSLAATAEQSAASFARTPGVSTADAKTAAQTIAAVPTFSGNASDLQQMLVLSQNVALVWNTTLPDAAKRVADAMRDPLAAAQGLAKDGFPAMTAAIVENIKTLTEQGDVLGAQREIMAAYADGVTGARDRGVTPFQQALADLDAAFTNSGNAGRSWGQGIGEAVMGIAAAAVAAVAMMPRNSAAAAAAPNATLNTDEFGNAYPTFTRDNPAGGAHPVSVTPASIYAQQAANTQLQLQADAASTGTNTSRRDTLTNQVDMLTRAQALVQSSTTDWKAYQEQIDADNAAIAKLGVTTDKHSATLAQQIQLLANTASSNRDATAAYLESDAAVQHLNAVEKARAEAIRLYPDDATKQALATIQLTTAYDGLLQSTVALNAAKDAATEAAQLGYLQDELRLVGATAEQRDHELAVLKERDKILKESGGNAAALETDAARAALANAGAVADATAALQHQQQVYSDLSNAGSQAFDQVGNSIANAFTNGSGHAVNFANVFKASIASILQEVAKLAIINPLLNAALGGTPRTTIFDLGSISGTSGSGSLGGVSSYLSSFADQGIFAPSGASAQNTGASALYGGAGGGAQDVGVTYGQVGGALAGIGAGYGAGTTASGMMGGNSQNSEIGAATGAVAGAIIGTFVLPVIGSFLGGALGGLIGGVGGGLLGPGPATHPWNTQVFSNSSGQLQIGEQGFNKFDGTGITSSIQAQLDAINKTTAAFSESVQNFNVNIVGIHGANPTFNLANAADFGKLAFSSTDAGLNSALQLQTGKGLGGGDGFKSAADLQAFSTLVEVTIPKLTNTSGSLANQITALNNQFSSAIFAAQGYGLATAALAAEQVKETTALQTAAAQAMAHTEAGFAARTAAATGDPMGAALMTFNDNATRQQQQLANSLVATYGDAYTATADYARVTGELNTALSAERDLLIANQAKQTDANWRTANDNYGAAQASGMVADAALTGNFSEALQAKLVTFAYNSNNQLANLANSLTTTFGTAYTQTADYAARMAMLQSSIVQQQAALIQQFYDQGRSQVTGTITSLANYATGLVTSAASPLSAQAKYALASGTFTQDATAAQGGDFTALGRLQTEADALLSTSQTLNGTGTQYVADYNRVLAALSTAAATNPDTLTNSAMAVISETQTQKMTAAIASLQAEVVLLRQEVAQGNLIPMRAAA